MQQQIPTPPRFHPHHHTQNQTEMGQNCLKTGTERFPSAPSPSPQNRTGSGRFRPKTKQSYPVLKTKYHSFALFFLSPRPGFTRSPLLSLCMADSSSCEPLSGLYMAPKSRYRKYGARNRNAHTCDIQVSVPHISHLVKHGPPNLPYISEIAPKHDPAYPESDRISPFLSDSEENLPAVSSTNHPHIPKIRQNKPIPV